MSEKKERAEREKAEKAEREREKAEREREKELERRAREDAAFALAHSTVHLMQRAQQVGADKFAKRGHPVSLRQFGVLAAIAAHPNASQSDLVRTASIDRSTLADMLKRLELMGLVAKSASETDGRANTVALTPRGRDVLAEGAEDAEKADHAVLSALPKAKRKGFHETLMLLAEMLDEEAEKVAREEKRKRKEALARQRKEEKKRKEKDCAAQ
jgi:DNA-binding MarR family transcriptional regulator